MSSIISSFFICHLTLCHLYKVISSSVTTIRLRDNTRLNDITSQINTIIRPAISATRPKLSKPSNKYASITDIRAPAITNTESTHATHKNITAEHLYSEYFTFYLRPGDC